MIRQSCRANPCRSGINHGGAWLAWLTLALVLGACGGEERESAQTQRAPFHHKLLDTRDVPTLVSESAVVRPLATKRKGGDVLVETGCGSTVIIVDRTHETPRIAAVSIPDDPCAQYLAVDEFNLRDVDFAKRERRKNDLSFEGGGTYNHTYVPEAPDDLSVPETPVPLSVSEGGTAFQLKTCYERSGILYREVEGKRKYTGVVDKDSRCGKLHTMSLVDRPVHWDARGDSKGSRPFA